MSKHATAKTKSAKPASINVPKPTSTVEATTVPLSPEAAKFDTHVNPVKPRRPFAQPTVRECLSAAPITELFGIKPVPHETTFEQRERVFQALKDKYGKLYTEELTDTVAEARDEAIDNLSEAYADLRACEERLQMEERLKGSTKMSSLGSYFEAATKVYQATMVLAETELELGFLLSL